MSEKHEWKPGDLFWHGASLYMVINPRDGSRSCLRLCDTDTALSGTAGVSVAAENWHQYGGARFVCNMQSIFDHLQESKFGYKEAT